MLLLVSSFDFYCRVLAIAVLYPSNVLREPPPPLFFKHKLGYLLHIDCEQELIRHVLWVLAVSGLLCLWLYQVDIDHFESYKWNFWWVLRCVEVSLENPWPEMDFVNVHVWRHNASGWWWKTWDICCFSIFLFDGNLTGVSFDILDIIKYLLMLWRTFWRHNVRLNVLFSYYHLYTYWRGLYKIWHSLNTCYWYDIY